VALLFSAISDRLYFGAWTFPPYQWLNFNIAQSLAVFYGTNDWHYYLTQGLPLLTTTYLPFVIYAIYTSTSISRLGVPDRISNVRFQLTFAILIMLATLSLVSHKEVRFIYPLLPILHIIAAPHMAAYLTTVEDPSGSNTKSQDDTNTTATDRGPPNGVSPTFIDVIQFPDLPLNPRRLLVTLLVIVNLIIAVYTTQLHQRGVISVISFLRQEYETVHMTNRGIINPALSDTTVIDEIIRPDPNETFAAFLMPCHSTPWRSHLVYPSLNAWALTCEPPLHIPATSPERQSYRDEADRFYDNPARFLREEINTKDRPWPRYVVGFEGIEEVLREYYEELMPGWIINEKWRTFNSHFHDDWRRKGDVIVWEFVDGSKVQS
jgi:phosphatidylinositol glycan class B